MLLHHSQQLTPAQSVACIHAVRWGKELKGQKEEQLIDWDEDSILCEGKNSNKWCKSTHSLFLWAKWCWSRVTAPENFPQCHCWAKSCIAWNINVVNLGQLSWLCPASLPTSSQYATGVEWKTEKSLMLYKHCSAAKALVLYQYNFGHRSKTWYHVVHKVGSQLSQLDQSDNMS